MIDRSNVLGLVLAGGQSRRMGGRDKALLTLGGQPLIEHVTAKLAAQTAGVAINSNSAAFDFAALDRLQSIPVIADEIGDHIGPLAGVHAGMQFASTLADISYIATGATDTPFFPDDLVNRLCAHVSVDTPIAMATTDGNRHPVFALWPINLADRLARWLAVTDTYKVVVFAREVGMTTVDFPLETGQDPFFNINTPGDLSAAEKRLSAT